MRATRLVSLVVPLLVVPGLAAAQSRYFSYERGIDRPGHAYRFLETHNAADCSLACQAANSCRAWTYVKPGAPSTPQLAERLLASLQPSEREAERMMQSSILR